MSGGAYNYNFGYLKEYAIAMREYDITVAKLLEDVIELCRDLEWCDSGDIDSDDLGEKIDQFKSKWIEATPDQQELVKKTILEYCNKVDKYTNSIRRDLKYME